MNNRLNSNLKEKINQGQNASHRRESSLFNTNQTSLLTLIKMHLGFQVQQSAGWQRAESSRYSQEEE